MEPPRAVEVLELIARLAPIERSQALKDLPREFVAVRFYCRPSFPDTAENRRFAMDTIRSISRDVPVVLLNTGLRPDEHDPAGTDSVGNPCCPSRPQTELVLPESGGSKGAPRI